LPSLTSIYAPASARGTAMGVFASSQFIGVFVGGLMGGALLDTVGAIGVWAGIAALTLVWAMILGLSRLASPEAIAAR
jgi:MFS family permease